MQIITISILLALFLLVQSDFLPKRLRIVDSNRKHNTFLVRGNLPINANDKFQFQQLKGNLSALTGSKRYELIVVSFLNYLTAKETKNKNIEQRFFSKNSKVAEYRSKTILGSFIDPTEMPDWFARSLSFLEEYIDFDGIDELITELREQIHGGETDKIVYIHCSAGVDRTGYVAGAYKMKYFNTSFRDVLSENIEVLKGLRKHMHFNAQNGLQWFCFSLGRTQEQCSVPS